MTILDMSVTEKELDVLTGGVVANVQEYASRDIKKPFLTRDAIELYIMRNQFDEAEKALSTLSDSDRAEFYPEGLFMRKN